MILNKSFKLVHYINNPYSKLNELIINELERYDYRDRTTNDFVDIIVVDFPPEYAIQFMK